MEKIITAAVALVLAIAEYIGEKKKD